LEAIFNQIITMLSKISESRTGFEHEKKNEEDEEGIDYEDDEENLDLLKNIGNELFYVAESLMKNHHKIKCNVYDRIMNEIVLIYTKNNSEYSLSVGLLFLVTLVEQFEEEVYKDNLDYIANQFVQTSSNQFPAVRQAANFGIGIFAQKSTSGFSKYAITFIESVLKAAQLKCSTDDDADLYARDNTIAALGKIIKYQSHCLNTLNENAYHPETLLNKWLGFLPLMESDEPEISDQYVFLCELILAKNQVICSPTNFNSVVTLLFKNYKTDNSNEKSNEMMVKVFDFIKNDENIKLAAMEVFKKLDEERKNVLKGLLN
jgi:hypothetical protein